MSILKTKNLAKRFDGVHAVEHLSIELGKGKVTGIIGPNGSGKTTLIHLLSGMLEIDGGGIVIQESHITRMQRHQAPFYGVTRTFQDVRVFEQMTVLDNILVVLTERDVFSSLFEKHGAEHLKKAEDVLRIVELWKKKTQLAFHLSYGERKLLEIARALAMNAEIFLLDEPFAGLFPKMVTIVCDVIRNLKQEGKTILLTEQNIELIRKLSDYIFVMDEGKLLAEGIPGEVLEKREVIEAYLGE